MAHRIHLFKWPTGYICLNGPPDTYVVVVVVVAVAAAIVSIHHAQYLPKWMLCSTPMTRKYAVSVAFPMTTELVPGL